MWSEEELHKELKELIEYKAWVDNRIDAVKTLLEPPPQGIKLSIADSTTRVIRVSRGGRMKQMADAIYPFLMEHGRPARREAMLEHLEKVGIKVTGETDKQRLALISSALSKDTRFKSMGRSTGQWGIDVEHMSRVSMLQDRQELDQDPSVHQPNNNDTPHYEQIQQSAATESEQVSDADDLPW